MDWDHAVRETQAHQSVIDSYMTLKDVMTCARHMRLKAELLHSKLTANPNFSDLLAEVRTDTIWNSVGFPATVEGTKEKWTGKVRASVEGSWVEVDQDKTITIGGELSTLTDLTAVLSEVFPHYSENNLSYAASWCVANDKDNTADTADTLRQIRDTNMPVQLLAARFGDLWLRPFILTGMLSPRTEGSWEESTA